MSSLTNINNNTRVVNVGRTTPVSPGQQPSSRSIPVVLATDQTPVPVEEQNKVQSEVSLSLLGIPRSEVALGIFADVNTYDVNPMEWSSAPQYYQTGHGIKHLPNEAGALVEAPRDAKAVLTSKRFFRYQPGRVSAATFGVKSTVSASSFARNPVIRKYGIFDNFDGYYWESRQNGVGDNFSVVRRTQSLLKFPTSAFGTTDDALRSSTTTTTSITTNQVDDYRVVGKEGRELKGTLFVRERAVIAENGWNVAKAAFTWVLANDTAFATHYNNYSTDIERLRFKEKCHRDVMFWLDFMSKDLEWGGNAHTLFNTKNYVSAILQTASLEVALHTRVKTELQNLLGGYVDAYNKVTSLMDNIVLAFFSAKAGGQTPAQASTTVFAANTLAFGTKTKVDTYFDTRKHYLSYFISTFDATTNDVYDPTKRSATATYQAYRFYNIPQVAALGVDTSAIPEGFNIPIDPRTASSAGYPFIPGDTVQEPGGGASIVGINSDTALALNELVDVIRNKCVRDMEYVMNGLKNDIVGGGNAETLYNASMFYKNSSTDADKMTIYTQFDTINSETVPREINKYKHIKDYIEHDFEDTDMFGAGAVTANVNTIAKSNDLLDILIGNFSTETTAGLELGQRGYAGNLIALRDGLLMVHAAVYDPNLLKEKKKIKAFTHIPYFGEYDGDTDQSELLFPVMPTRFKITEGTVTFGQKVRMFTASGADFPQRTFTYQGVSYDVGPYVSGAIYEVASVYGPTGNEFTLRSIDNGGLLYTQYDDGGVIKDYTFNTVTNGVQGTDDYVYFETVVPFIFPSNYDPGIYRSLDRPSGVLTTFAGEDSQTVYEAENDPFPQGMVWPLKYSSSVQLDDTEAMYIGTINTALDPNADANTRARIRRQYDSIIMNPEYINWIKNNVKPEYWGVYEYRIPRGRFSHDKLDGKESKRVYSDMATGPTGIVRPGMQVLDDDGIWTNATSEYNFDFTKVTMLKVEFSWYGAVGALFLAYIPVGNGEARWVRVHHLRASNQLKIASLGNATLPITYNVWGGGSLLTQGDPAQDTEGSRGYGSSSHHIVKYGASYYIDGGDRGTVRLYSHNNETSVPAYGKRWSYAVNASGSMSATIPGTTTDGVTTPDLTYFMNAGVLTGNPVDSGIKVIWADSTKVYFNKEPIGNTLTLVPDRAEVVYGLETKDVILSTIEGNPVRNRVQVYPTKLSTVNLGNTPVRLRMKKTPLFQTLTQPNGTLTLNELYEVTAANLPLNVTESAAPDPYIQNGEFVYGWFQAIIGDIDDDTVFGRLYREANDYYFELLESFSESVVLKVESFLPDKRFARDSNGDPIVVTSATAVTVPTSDNLSSIRVVNNTVVPIPNTGINIATIYMTSGGTEQLDMGTYFDYNKEYLSYPLTDAAETLYFAVDSDVTVADAADNISIGLTWEEQ